MTPATIRVGNGAGFLGDRLDAPRRLVEASSLDYLTLEYLAELTMSILARQKEKDPAAGYAEDFLTVLEDLLPALDEREQLKIVTNAGGMNPRACAIVAAKRLAAAGRGDELLGVLTGDDLLPRLAELRRAGCVLANLDTGQPLAELTAPVVSANAYLGAAGIVEALAGGARYTIAGRVADASLTLGPAIHEFGWRWDDWNELAGASVAGHLIECGAQVTGGYSDLWPSVDLADVGYPIAELAPSGDCTILKPEAMGGVVSRRTVIEQLVYEIGDPRHYLTPDVDCDFTSVSVEEIGANRVAVTGARGAPRPKTLKVSLAYRDGYAASATLLVTGENCLAKARDCARIVWTRLARLGVQFHRQLAELLGAGQAALSPDDDLIDEARFNGCEVVLRLSVHDARREAVERFTREIAPLITSGPAGLAGYAAGRAVVRPVFAYWPTLVPRELVEPQVEVRKANEWQSIPL